MKNGSFIIPHPVNEPVLTYVPGSSEREALQRELTRQLENPVQVPLIIGGVEVKSGVVNPIRVPHDHSRQLGEWHQGSAEHMRAAIDAALKAGRSWGETPMEERAAIFLKAAHLLSTTWRARLNAATMLNLSKSVHQAEIDAAAELADFFRFNVWYMQQIYAGQPPVNGPGEWNRLEYRPLEGFIFAVTPFNFASIAGNLPTAPAIMGNTVVFKPASSAVLPAYYIMELLREAGLPDGVINFIPGKGSELGPVALDHRELAGVHFTGSTGTFNNMAEGHYRTYPRLVGETGGKDFVLAAPDATVRSLAVALFRGAFEYQGQKCSAASRAYIPRSLWPEVKAQLRHMTAEAKMGDVTDFTTFLGAVIDEGAFKRITGYIDYGKADAHTDLVAGGEYDGAQGWFVQPTIFETTDPHSKLMEEEIFGPVLTVYVYDDEKLFETAALVDATSPFALTGAVFTKERETIDRLSRILRHAAGNFYINDKPTGAVVGQQPFGGARGSGTNDKAGSQLNLLRFTSPRTIKENFSPPTSYTYPHMG